MEHTIRQEILDHLNANSIITTKQHGFLHGRSCRTNLLETLEEWTAALDAGYGIDVIYLDYRKAFDTVPHARLINKMRGCGVQGHLLRWVREFLKDRQMRVKVRGSCSDWTGMDSGVPQGSVVGPFLFLIYVNDIPAWMKNSIRMFADDTKIWTRIRDYQDAAHLQEDLDLLQKWSETWLLRFNTSMCLVMHVGHKLDTKYYLSNGGMQVELSTTDEERERLSVGVE